MYDSRFSKIEIISELTNENSLLNYHLIEILKSIR